ncbi:hypothetical protein OE88DRAFT_1665918 [Heliocybe sulcata]|uniref:DUF6533 domain-containing protein n=1 Tax=Heliocybe sulcata TaxID=5364 RepID=A0A5C3MRJ6_9AGAM|nr:hypothetical protein OE88DRAFT_1665918 [Heliocybe sulcata]
MTSPVALLTSLVSQIQQTRYAELASSSIVVFDHLVTLDQEIELIWKARWTPGKALFFINRYYVLGSVIFNNYVVFSSHLSDTVGLCVRWIQWQGCTGIISTMVVEIILQLRLYALYQLNRGVLVFMCCAFIVSVSAGVTIMALVLLRLSANSQIIPGIVFCIPVNAPSFFYAFWIPTLAFESLLCGLALYKAFKDFRSRSTVFQSGRHIIKVLIRDSVVYYLVMFATYFANLVIFLTGNPGQLESGIGFGAAMSCVMGSRLSLNIRGVHHELEVSAASETHNSQSQSQSQSLQFPGISRKGTLSRGTVVVSGSYPLNDFELVELRNLKPEAKV